MNNETGNVISQSAGGANGTAQLITEREKTHGDFKDNAKISQRLKEIIRAEGADWEAWPAVYRESLDMIALKLSRILSGQYLFKDHWDDIAGYAHLAAQATQPAERSANVSRDVDFGPPVLRTTPSWPDLRKPSE